MLLKILLRIRQIELRLHRQHEGKLLHDLDESAPKRAHHEHELVVMIIRTEYGAPKRAHHEHELVVMIIRTEYGTLDSLQAQGADVTPKTTSHATL